MSLSNLPGRRMAGSIMSGRLLAPITTTLTRDSMPSISVSNWLITRSDAPLSPRSDPLLGATESSSSKKTMDGAALRPFLKTSRIPFSDSPTHLLKSSGPLMEMKLASLSVATALASMVLPHPGGPKSRIPFGGLIPTLVKASGFFIGHSTASWSSCFTSQSPDVRPVDGGYFDVDFPHRGGCYFPVGGLEIVQVHLHLFKHFTGDSLLLQVNAWKVEAQGLHRSLSAECRYIRAGVAVANVRQPVKIHIQGQWHRSRVNLQNLMSARFVGDSDLYFPVEAPGASERRVDGVRPIRSAYHDDVSPGGHAVHEGEQLSHNSTFHFSRHFLSLWSDGVHLVDEYDTGRALLSFLKNLPQPGL